MSMSKFLLVLAVGSLLCFEHAYAAEGEDSEQSHSWTSCYVGGNLGYGWGKDHAIDTVTNPGLNTRGDIGTGPAGGTQFGCDYQFASNWVVGLQGMFDGTGINGSHVYSPGSTEMLSYNTDWAGSLTGRVGYAVIPQALVYLKGGATGAHVNYTDTDPTGPYTFRSSTMRVGWTIGGGAEYAFQSNWSSFIEYSYTDLGTQSDNLQFAAGNSAVYGGAPDGYRQTRNLQTILVGVNYHFISW